MKEGLLVEYKNQAVKLLRQKIEEAHAKLADSEAFLSLEKHQISVMQGEIFKNLREISQERDRLRLIVKFRKKLLENHLNSKDNEMAKIQRDFRSADEANHKAYNEAEKSAFKNKALTEEEQNELRLLWKKLVKLFHPDLVHDDPEKSKTFHNLTQAINHAKSNDDLETLREIAEDPNGFIQKKGWASVDLEYIEDIERLKAQLEMIEKQIEEVLSATRDLKDSEDYKLHQLCQKDKSLLNKVIERQRGKIEKECVRLKKEAQLLQTRIHSETGISDYGIK